MARIPTNKIARVLGQRIAEQRRARDMSREELAERVGVSARQVVGRWERAEREHLTVAQLVAIARALDVAPSVFLDGM